MVSLETFDSFVTCENDFGGLSIRTSLLLATLDISPCSLLCQTIDMALKAVVE